MIFLFLISEKRLIEILLMNTPLKDCYLELWILEEYIWYMKDIEDDYKD